MTTAMTTTLARRSMLRALGTAPSLKSASPTLLSRRWATTQTETVTPRENIAILNTQREKRPISPHLSIYKPQLTWYPSMFNRITGVALSGTLYLSAIAYLFHPYIPVIDSAHLISLVHSMPTWLKGSAKLIFALPFTFHTFNGIRHLAWDLGYGLSLKGVYAGAYTVLGATAISSAYLAFFM